MASVPSLVPALVGALLVVGLVALVHRDARRVGVTRPRLWAGLVLFTCGGALLGYLFVPFVPRPGLLAFAVGGPVLYLFERDDAKHGDEPADPRTLASGLTGGPGSGSGSGSSDEPGSDDADESNGPN